MLSGRILALDPGEVRTGIAISDPGRTIARPYAIVESKTLIPDLKRIVEEEAVEEALFGVPKTLSGEIGFQARWVLDVLKGLTEALPEVRFVQWDERFTTRMARSGGGSRRVDDVAAAYMLQEYLDMRRGKHGTIQ